MKKRLLSLLLVLAMVFTLLPMSALADAPIYPAVQGNAVTAVSDNNFESDFEGMFSMPVLCYRVTPGTDSVTLTPNDYGCLDFFTYELLISNTNDDIIVSKAIAADEASIDEFASYGLDIPAAFGSPDNAKYVGVDCYTDDDECCILFCFTPVPPEYPTAFGDTAKLIENPEGVSNPTYLYKVAERTETAVLTLNGYSIDTTTPASTTATLSEGRVTFNIADAVKDSANLSAMQTTAGFDVPAAFGSPENGAYIMVTAKKADPEKACCFIFCFITPDSAVTEVEGLITDIGTVTLDSESAITAARDAYDKLLEEKQAKVLNSAVLTAAENALWMLKNQPDGNGTADSPYLLKTADNLIWLSNTVKGGSNCKGKYFSIENDITLPANWFPIGGLKSGQTSYVYDKNGLSSQIYPFNGIIDGGSHKITVPVGSLPLLGGGSFTVKNLKIYGEKIPSYGLAAYYRVGQTVNIENVTILSGSHILKSGLLGGYGNNGDSIIRNCTVEGGVVIGDDGTWSSYDYDGSKELTFTFGPVNVAENDMVGSIVGGFNGTVTGCTSGATVYGRNWVGGIFGFKGQSMRECIINDCVFTGSVIASGEGVGGILGSGYVSPSAPNTPCATVENCLVTGSVTGATKVGGIFGGELGSCQNWGNGIGRIRNNVFNGSVSATAQDGIVGGIVGYMYSFDIYNHFYGNYYIDTVAKGIGQLNNIILRDDTSAGKSYGRLDAPTDADTLNTYTTAVSAAALSDGTVLARLKSNKAGDSWVAGEVTPVINTAVHITGVVGKTYTSAYMESNPPLELTKNNYSVPKAKKLLVSYSDGRSLVEVPGSALSFYGVDFTKGGIQLCSVDYENYQFTFGVKVADTAVVMALIDAIGSVTKDSGSAISAARSAYDAINSKYKSQLADHYELLTQAEAAFAKIDPAALVAAAKTTIEALHFDLSMASGNTTEEVRRIVERKLQSLSIGGVETVVTMRSDFEAAIAGTAGSPAGTDGSFSFTVALKKGEKTGTATVSDAKITPLAYTAADPEEAKTITVSIRLIGAKKAMQDVDLSDNDYLPQYVNWIATRSYTLPKDSTVYDLVIQAFADAGIRQTGADTNYISTIFAPSVYGGYALSEFTNGKFSGWMYTINGSHPGFGLKEQVLTDNDVVVWHYVNDYRHEVRDWFDDPLYPALGDGTKYNKWLDAEDVNPPADPAAPTKQENGSQAEASVAVKTETAVLGNTVKAEITENSITAAVEAVKTSGKNAMTITPEVKGETKTVEVTIPKTSAESIVKDTSASLVIESGKGSVTIPNDALASITAQAAGSTVSVTVEQKAAADVTDKTINTEGAVIVSVSIKSGDKAVTDFGGKEIEISLPVSNKFVEGQIYKVIELSDDGTAKTLTGKCVEVNGVLTVQVSTKGLSTFVVTRSKAMPFADIASGYWALEGIQFVFDNDLMNGVGDSLFDPEGTLNRAMLVTMLYRLEGKPAVTAANPFTDVLAGQWYTNAIIWAATNKIVDGYGDGTFGPLNDITREQLAKMLFAYAQYKKYDVTKASKLSGYTDTGDVSAWALGAVKWANAEGLISGRTAATIVPGGNAKRCEAATILTRYIKNVAQ